VPREVQPLVQRTQRCCSAACATRLEAQQHFVADAAHELRSPLTALKLQVQACGARARRRRAPLAVASSAPASSAPSRWSSSCSRWRGRRAAAGARPSRWTWKSWRAQAVSELLPTAQAKQIDLGLAPASAAGGAARPRALHLILRNLVDNAIKYTPAGGRVDIAHGPRRAPWLAWTTAAPASGGGAQRVFDRFYRVPGSEAPGSGLGLAIVKTVADRWARRCGWAASPSLGGLRVEVRFPAAPDAEAVLSLA
jgi:two-component system OmpR family sensor kinase